MQTIDDHAMVLVLLVMVMVLVAVLVLVTIVVMVLEAFPMDQRQDKCTVLV